MTSLIETIYIIDDDSLIRRALSRFFEYEGYAVQTFESADTFLVFNHKTGPGCIILDVMMPGKSGLELQAELNAVSSSLPIIFISGRGTIPMSVQALQGGAITFLEKPVENDELLRVVREALEDHRSILSENAEREEILRRFHTLTHRERQVFGCAIQGMLNKHIAESLNISESTVKTHRRRIMEKMSANSVPDLVRMVARADLDNFTP